MYDLPSYLVKNIHLKKIVDRGLERCLSGEECLLSKCEVLSLKLRICIHLLGLSVFL